MLISESLMRGYLDGKKDVTKYRYAIALRFFADFWGHRDMESFGIDGALEYAAFLQDRVNNNLMSASTRALNLRVLSSFCTYLIEHGVEYGIKFVGPNPLLSVADFSDTAVLERNVANLNDVDKLLAAARDTYVLLAVRLALELYLTVSEILYLSDTDIYVNHNNQHCIIVRRGKQERRIVLSDDLYNCMTEHFRANPCVLSLHRLFATSRGVMRDVTLRRRLEAACKDCGIPYVTLSQIRNAGIGMFAGSADCLANIIGSADQRHTQRLMDIEPEYDVTSFSRLRVLPAVELPTL